MSRKTYESLLRLVSDPTTPTEMLTSLTRGKALPHYVLSALLQNPNVSPELVAALNPYSARALLQNPAWPLWLLEDPTFLCRLNPYAIEDLVSSGELAESLLSMFAAHESANIRRAIASNWRASGALLRHLAKDKDESVRSAVARNPSSPQDLLRRLTEDQRESVSACAKVRYLQTPIKDLCQIAEASNPKIRALVLACARYPRGSYELLLRAGASRDLSCATPSRTLGHLTPEECLQLAGGGGFAKELLAAHPQATEASLSSIAREDNYRVRKILERRRGLSDELLRQLANTTYVALRDPPRALLPFLAEHSDRSHRAAAAVRADLPDESLKKLLEEEKDLKVLAKALSNVKVSGAALAQFATHSDDMIRRMVARHHNTPRRQLVALLGDLCPRVRRAAASNPRSPEQAIATYQRAGATPDLFALNLALKRQPRLRQEERELLQETPFGRRLLSADFTQGAALASLQATRKRRGLKALQRELQQLGLTQNKSLCRSLLKV